MVLRRARGLIWLLLEGKSYEVLEQKSYESCVTRIERMQPPAGL
jgi:hypothetical protein